MFLKKQIIVVLLCSFFAFLYAGNSFAEDGFCSGVIVNYAGAYSPLNAKIVHLTNPANTCGNWVAGTSLFFILDDSNDQANAMLAAALTALASGNPIIAAPSDATDGGVYTNWASIVAIYAGSANAPTP